MNLMYINNAKSYTMVIMPDIFYAYLLTNCYQVIVLSCAVLCSPSVHAAACAARGIYCILIKVCVYIYKGIYFL